MLRKLWSYAKTTNARSKDEITLLYVGIRGEKTKLRSKDKITHKRRNHAQNEIA
jgi:hypothetical protein